MAARGSIVKDAIAKKILDTFQGSFVNGKEIRIPGYEDGELIQIKVTLTAAKENVESGGPALSMPTTAAKAAEAVSNTKVDITKPDSNEIEAMRTVIQKLGL